MNNALKAGLIAAGLVSVVVSSSSYADVDALTASFAGGCRSNNTTGACTIKVAASGSEMEGNLVTLLHADSQKGPFRKVSAHDRALDSDGNTAFKFRNKAGCYKVVTAENGNDAADVTSRKICEK